jgi:hypothetical protein
MRKALVRAPLFAAVLACATAQANQAGPAGDPEYFVEGLRCLGGKHSLVLPPTLPALLALAPGVRVKELRKERTDGNVLVHQLVSYDGLTINLIAYGRDPDRYSLEKVEIRSAAWARLSPFTVGKMIDEARAVLGPVSKDDDALRSVYSGENESLRFETRSDRVSAIVYECYTG